MDRKLRHRDKRLRAKDIGDGIEKISLSSRPSRLMGMTTSVFLVGDILIDTGFSMVRDLLVEYLKEKKIRVIVCTHNHEDHSGNCGILAQAHGCPVYMAHPEKKDEEGVATMAFYRRVWWGWPGEYQPEPMPDKIQSAGRTLISVPTPGHSQTHTAFFEEETGLLFSGDLYIAGGVTAVMSYENPYQSVESLRRVAELKPRRMLNGHGLTLDDPADELLLKADKIEAAARQVLDMHHQGASRSRILNALFKDGRIKDWFHVLLTGGEFSRRNFVKACIAHRTPECAGMDIGGPMG
jgi:glyoxylase-like metal-dependent hydrolase (beta-lactamase superfamily II)